MVDRYTKVVLTLIAVALVWLCFQATWSQPLKVGPKGRWAIPRGVQPVTVVDPVEVSNTVEVSGSVDVNGPVELTGTVDVDQPVSVDVDNWGEAAMWLGR
jgi:hypothetical protein